MMKSLAYLERILKQKGGSGRLEIYELYQQQVQLNSTQVYRPGGDGIWRNMSFNLKDKKIKQHNRKIATFPFVVYWRHYG